MLSSLNEAFADLLAHYIQNNSSRQMTSLSCQFFQRDPSNEFFNDRTYKTFNKVVDDFSQDFCGRIGIDDVHTLGSVLSYFWDQYIQLYGISSVIDKGRLLIKTTESFLSSIPSRRPDDPLIVVYLKNLESNMSSLYGGLRPEHCALMRSVFGNLFTAQSMEIVVSQSCGRV